MRTNRFKNKSKNKKKLSLKKYFFIGLFFCLFIGLAYFIIWSPYFLIENIKIEGQTKHLQGIKEIVTEKAYEKNIFLAPINQIREDVLEKYSDIKDVKITRQLPNILNIQVQQRKNIGIWCQIQEEEKQEELEQATSTEEVIEEVIEIVRERKINQCFYFDPEGIIFQEAPLMSGSLILNVYEDEKPIEIRDQVMSEDLVKFILDVKKGLSEMSLSEAEDFEIVYLEDLRVTTVQGWQIYFNPTESVGSQLEALKVVIEKEAKESLDSIKYFDLRIEGRIYYQ